MKFLWCFLYELEEDEGYGYGLQVYFKEGMDYKLQQEAMVAKCRGKTWARSLAMALMKKHEQYVCV